ncbi:MULTISPECIES: DUF6221 family protein [Streptomyces]|uniref:DUF6221 family protein n=1 Tax=Streptomyces TaxID=1883 RepID=UPI0004CDB4E5|nr:DUF6221 family protein [Streptomyces durhamensis]
MTAGALERFLRDRFQEEERVARDAVTAAPGAVWGVMADHIEQVLTSRHHGTTHTPLVQFGAEDPVRLLTHVARHDPARVLRNVEAGRALLAEHRPTDDGRCRTCATAADGGPPPAPCATLRLLALPFAGHAEYDETWRP